MNKAVPNLIVAFRSLHVSSTLRLPRGKTQFFNIHKKVTDPARQDPDYFEKEAAKLPLGKHQQRVPRFRMPPAFYGNTTV